MSASNDRGRGGPIVDRSAGILLHPTSLPGTGPFGVLGEAAYRFVDFALSAGFRYWQTLPLGPVDQTLSPYQLRSVYAGNPRLVDLAELARAGWLSAVEAEEGDATPLARRRAFATARRRFIVDASFEEQNRLRSFEHTNAGWLEDYALFESLSRNRNGAPWWRWPRALRKREAGAIDEATERFDDTRADVRFEQFLFERQWGAVRTYANSRGLKILGDLPFYIDCNSADVWCSPELFRLDANDRPTAVSGVPPDFFSSDGQLWGHPLYDWDRMQDTGFEWWVSRLRQQLSRFDLIRLDHFRAFEAHWAVPAEATTARDGTWIETPGEALFATLAEELGSLPFVAEDLGTITPEVTALRERFGMPGLIVLQFAFDGSPDNPYLPQNHAENAVVYTGTHDNDTTLGWYAELDDVTRSNLGDALGEPLQMPESLIHAAYRSKAKLAVIPMQDLLGLGGEARMNLPGTVEGNWRWRFEWEQLDDELASRYHAWARDCQRA